jgi:hypothetical protein
MITCCLLDLQQYSVCSRPYDSRASSKRLYPVLVRLLNVDLGYDRKISQHECIRFPAHWGSETGYIPLSGLVIYSFSGILILRAS